MSPSLNTAPLEDGKVGALCHKLRTPLTAALGFVQLSLRDSSLSDAQSHNLRLVDEQLRRMSRLIDELASGEG
jgi:signal transduction histidine kinase